MTLTSAEDLLRTLSEGSFHRFSEWPPASLPNAAAGVYSIWDDRRLVYVGMSGRGATVEQVLERKALDREWGLKSRLKSHRAGRRSGDQFCVYVGDWLVLPTLTPSEIQAISTRAMSFDHLIRDFIQSKLGFRFVETESGSAALELERLARAGSLGHLPLLNPTEFG